ncbi:MAG: copper chaperone PCu(A)C [Chloroflexi bacterium]|nr:copper chaperone PCu(A)C [Chloroflexota bacterium]
MKPWIALLVLALSLFVLSACSTPAPVPAADIADCSNLAANGPKIKIDGAWTKATGTNDASNAAPAASIMNAGMNPPPSINTAAYLVIHNCAMQSDSLVKATSNVKGMTKLMNFEMKDGKSTMIDVNQIDIPAGKKVELKSGGFHVMLMKLKKDLMPGDPVELTLTFKNAGDIKVTSLAKSK